MLTSFLVVAAWAYLIWSGSILTIWPMFGVSNQLLAAIAFGVGTTVIIKSGKAKYAWITLVPMAFMFTTTFTASWELIGIFAAKAHNASSPSDAMTFRIDMSLVIVMGILAITVLVDMLWKWYLFFAGTSEKHAEGMAE